jgi:hypothetical protein
MPLLSILCPITNEPFTTSVETSVQHKASLPNIIKFSYCPYCHALHGWTPDEAFFENVYVSSECTAGKAQQVGDESLWFKSTLDRLPLAGPQAMGIDIARTFDRIGWFLLGVFATLLVVIFGWH